jgi:asparagine synthase (glutamine-hydrolysing)
MGVKKIAEKINHLQSFLAHRGPDDVGHYVGDKIGLAHTRLSIIDIEGGRQPLTNEKQTIYLVANGEIYNYKELRRNLTSNGHKFRTASDCETIIHLYEQYGKDCVVHLDGMFAFALWDCKEEKLMLARDRFGVKPLYLASSKDGICFASELTALVRSGVFEKEINPQALYAYLALSYVPGPMSIFRNVEKVMPSERIIFCNDDVQRDIYWRPIKVTVPRKQTEAIHELSWRLEESVRAHLVSDVPVGAFLSGGVDSSTIVALALKHADIETFCVSFPGTGVDEAPIARRVAEYLGTRHHDITVEIDPQRLIHETVSHMDEPFADSSALPTYAVCKAARQVTKVVLSGDGGDEVFGGYTGRYRAAALKAVVPKPHRIAQWLRRLPPWRTGHRSSLPEMLELAALPDEERYIFERQITSTSNRAALFNHRQAFEYEQCLKEIATKPLAKFAHRHPIHRALWMDLTTSLADDMLVKVDRMSMAHGLEVRVPLLDHRLVEFALSVPPNWLVSSLPVEGKRLLRQVVTPLLPEDTLNRPKQGFVIPLNDWLNTYFISMFDTLCLSSGSCLAGLLDQEVARKLRNQCLGNVPRQDLYALLILELWLRRLKMVKE